MYTKLTLAERLKDLRVSDKQLTLEQLAEETGLSKSALGRYETEECKDVSPFAIATLARFYDVSTDYLLGLSENKNHSNAELQSLHLSDAMIDLLQSGKLNTRLLCEWATHPAFCRLLIDMEIYIDRIADMRVHDMNLILEATRQQIIREYAPDENDLHLRTLELAQVQEDDYFQHVVHEDMDVILRDLQQQHRVDATTADEPTPLKEIQDELSRAARFCADGEDSAIRYFCDQMGIPYDELTSEEFSAFLRILSKSRFLKPNVNIRGKSGARRYPRQRRRPIRKR